MARRWRNGRPFVGSVFVPQNAIQMEPCLCITNGKSRRDPPKESFGPMGPALANWIGEVETEVG